MPQKGIRGKGPEGIIQKAIMDMLKVRDWSVTNMHGNMYQSGIPDLYACHARLGTRWIEVKVKDKYKFTAAQLEKFPEWDSKGVGIWVLTAATETEYKKLFQPANWWTFLQSWKHNSRLGI